LSPPPSRRKTRPVPGAAPARELSRSEARDAAARAQLTPLAPGERPVPLVAAIAVAGALALANLIAYLAGATIGGKHPGPGVLAFTAVVGTVAGGMALARYWAVLLFEILLTLTILFFSLFLVEARGIGGAALCVGVLVPACWLFWKLVRVMGRIAVTQKARGSGGAR
jgi:hypothetical protein